MRPRSILLPFLTLLAPVAAQAGGRWEPAAQLRGQQAYHRLGYSVAALGDLDGDGVSDLTVGAPGHYLGSVTGEVSVYSGRTTALLFRIVDTHPIAGLGFSVAAAGDVNADGVPDLIAGAGKSHAYTASNNVVRYPGAALVFSGADGSLIHHLPGDNAHFGFGAKVAGVGDLDLDGHADLIVNTGHHPFGYVQVISGATGRALYTLQSPHPVTSFGDALSGLGDLDGDGHPEFAIGDPEPLNQELRIYSGATGRQLRALHGDEPGGAKAFGRSILDLGDVNGDQVSDFAVGDPFFTKSSSTWPYGRVSIYSGATTALIRHIESDRTDCLFGAALAGPLDVNGDGRVDLAVGLPGARFSSGGTGYQQGAVQVFDCMTGRLLSFLRPVMTGGYPQLGFSLAAPGDLNRDGFPEIVAGAPFDRIPGGPKETGSVLILSYNPFQWLDATTLSAGGNQTVTITVDFPDAEAGAPYLLAFSRFGTGPMRWGNTLVPLSPDPLQSHTSAGWQPGNVIGGKGVLGPAGEAQILVLSHPRLTPLVGRKVFLATVTYSRKWGFPLSSSGVGILEVTL